MLKSLDVDINDYFVMGFSAGAHLASFCAGDYFGFELAGLARPCKIVLAYPLENFLKGGSIIKMCRVCAFGVFPDKKNIEAAYVPKHISKDCPPIFLWQTKDDESVPYDENSKALYKAAVEAGVRVKYKVVEHGPHGMGIARGSEAEGWLSEAVRFC